MESLMETYRIVRDRADGVCEGERCSEVHLEPAKTYRGRVILLINHLGSKIVNDAEKMKLLCLKCSGSLDYIKTIRLKKHRKKKAKSTNQVELFN